MINKGAHLNPASSSQLGVIQGDGVTVQLNGSGVLSLAQSIAPGSTPTFVSLTLSATTNQLTLGTGGNTATFNAAGLTGARIVNIPDAGSTTVIGSSAGSNQFATGISSGGIISYAQPSFANISGTAAIAQGGTNSTTALNNNRIMVSSSGSIVESGALTNGQLLIGATSGAPVVAALTGTADQVIVTNGSGSITLSLPQSIATSSTPTFAQATITNAPVAGTDAANKAYVDATAQGLDVKASCTTVATANITLSGTQTINGYAVQVGDRVLVNAQTSNVDNGIYVAAAGAWARSSDFASGTTQQGAFTFIESGTFANTGWVDSSNAVVGTGATTFVQFSGAGTYTAGTGLTLTGNQFSITAVISAQTSQGSATAVPVISYNAQGQLTAVTVTPIAINGNQITTGTVAIANGGTGQSTQQAAINALSGGVTSGSYLRGDGTNVLLSTIQAGDLPLATASTAGAVIVGTNIGVSSGTISVATGSNLVKGVVQVDGTSISATAGVISEYFSYSTSGTTTIDLTQSLQYLTGDTTANFSTGVIGRTYQIYNAGVADLTLTLSGGVSLIGYTNLGTATTQVIAVGEILSFRLLSSSLLALV